jgi:hypothetical protein
MRCRVGYGLILTTLAFTLCAVCPFTNSERLLFDKDWIGIAATVLVWQPAPSQGMFLPASVAGRVQYWLHIASVTQARYYRSSLLLKLIRLYFENNNIA